MLRQFAVRNVKPLLSDSAWQSLRRLSPGSTRRDAQKTLSDARRRQSEAEAEAQRAREEARIARAALDQQSRPGPSLTDLAKKYRTDKFGKWHRYTPHYEHHLAYLRHQRFTLLEIGIGGYKRDQDGGNSLRMWKEFFPNAQILGLDIEDKTFVNQDRIKAYVGSQTDDALLHKIVADADNLRVIIDDGSHQNPHIMATFDILFPLLQDDSHYIIEDTQTSYWPRYGGSIDPTATHTSNGLAKTFIDDINYEDRTDADHEPTYTEQHIVGLHVYKNLVFVDKNLNNEGRSYLSHD